jgi:quercetin dioxygenase-like cupin family protein
MSTEKKELELDKNGLPDIMQVLPPEYVHRTTFIIPKVQPYTTIATGNESHKSTIGVRLLSIEGKQATPFHKNPAKDKTYVVLGGYIRVYVYVNGQILEHERSFMNNTLLIPADTPHAVVGIGEGGNQVIVAFAPDVDDAVWQKGASEMNGKKGQDLLGTD